jgi:hypothetical protein
MLQHSVIWALYTPYYSRASVYNNEGIKSVATPDYKIKKRKEKKLEIYHGRCRMNGANLDTN